MNQTARVIWEALGETGSEGECSGVVAEVFGIPEEVAARDVRETVRGWRESGLIGPVVKARRTAVKGGELGTHIADCRIEGVEFRLLTDAEEAVAEIGPRLESVRVAGGEPDFELGVARVAGGFALVRDGELVAVDETVAGCRALMFQEMVRLAMPGREWLALLHAGACGAGGRCVIFPAGSLSGKTTLTAALMRDGLFAYSDDFVGVEAGSFGVPVMPFALAVREGSWPMVGESFPELWAGEVHLRFGTPVRFLAPRVPEPLVTGRACGLVFTRWESGADGEPQPLSVLETVIRLNGCGFWVAHDRASIAAFLGWLTALRRYSVRYGDVGHVAPLVRELISAS